MFKKAITLLVAFALILTVLVGCGSGTTNTSNAAGTSTAASASGDAASTTVAKGEPYTVNFAYHAPKEGNQQEVADVITKIALEKLNMKVNLIPISWDTYMSKFPAMLAAKEPMDIAFNFSFTRASFLDAGYIVDASKYTDYTKDIAQTLGEDVNAGYVGDFLVGFPMMNSRCFPSAIFVRKDIFDALGYKESDFNVNTDDMSSFDQITQMLAKIKEKYPDIIPFDGNRTFLQNYLTYADGFGDSFGVLENYGQTTKITNWYESEQCRQFALLARKWFTGGYTSKDIAVSKDTGRDKMKTGKSASFFASYVANQVGNIKTMTGYDTVCIPVSLKVKTTTAVNGALNSVMYQSKDKVKAFQFLNWIYTSADFNNLLNWGVPGKDWVVNKDGFADFPEGVTLATVNYHEDFGFIYPNQYLMTPWVGNPKDIWDQYRAFDKDNILSKAYGFSFNPASVVNELGQCSTVLTKYESDIGFGVVDPLPALEKFNKELKAAGLQKIIDEKQKQLDAWLATKK